MHETNETWVKQGALPVETAKVAGVTCNRNVQLVQKKKLVNSRFISIESLVSTDIFPPIDSLNGL